MNDCDQSNESSQWSVFKLWRVCRASTTFLTQPPSQSRMYVNERGSPSIISGCRAPRNSKCSNFWKCRNPSRAGTPPIGPKIGRDLRFGWFLTSLARSVTRPTVSSSRDSPDGERTQSENGVGYAAAVKLRSWKAGGRGSDGGSIGSR